MRDPEGVMCDNLRADGWADPEEARALEARIALLRAAVERAVAHLAGVRRMKWTAADIVCAADIECVEVDLSSALSALDAAGEAR